MFWLIYVHKILCMRKPICAHVACTLVTVHAICWALYVDDLYLQWDMYQSCLTNILDTIKLLKEVSFVIHPDKSVLTPSQAIVFLGFVISSKHMTLSFTDENKNIIKMWLINCHGHQISLRELARILGNIVASFPAVTFRPLHYRRLERNKIRCLKYQKGNLEGKISLCAKAVSEIHWWINNIDNSCQHINILNPDITIHTDASLTGWGINNGISLSRGLWHKAELDHINVLKLKAIEIGIYTYCKNKSFLHVRVMCDNVTVIAYINNMGSIKSKTCNNIACRIWNFCLENKLWVSPTHIPGKI